MNQDVSNNPDNPSELISFMNIYFYSYDNPDNPDNPLITHPNNSLFRSSW